jgi:beta-1,4-mannosyl-glycoprotein beta-1,4-N-acetylglucosaminyltransferase
MIIDAFPFNDELDLLELRLGQLDSVVDKFVLVETNLTYRGQPKPLYYQENKQQFEKWNHKIVAVDTNTPRQGAWYFEIAQRNVLTDVIRGLNPSVEDTIVFSDCDEIPNPEVVKNYTPDLGLRNLKQYTFYYNFNHMFNYGERSWSRARIGRVADLYQWGAYEFRQGPRDLDPSFPSLENGGWHGSYFGLLPKIRRKVDSISHDDMAPFIHSRTNKELLEDIYHGKDLYHRAGIADAQFWAENDPRLPSYFLQNFDRFRMFTNAWQYNENLKWAKANAYVPPPFAPQPSPTEQAIQRRRNVLRRPLSR